MSYSYAVDKEREKVFRLPHEDVRAGLQANLRFFILHSAAVFLVEDDTLHLVKQVSLETCMIFIKTSYSLQTKVSQKPLFLALVREIEYAHRVFESHLHILKV